MVMVTIHVLEEGLALCRFCDGPPGKWPLWNIWVRRDDVQRTATACADRDHDIHAFLRHIMCPDCMLMLPGATAL